LVPNNMLHSPTYSISTQPAYVAMGCVHPQFTLNRANVTRPPAKSVNRCRKSLVYKELYLQTVFAAGWRSWVGLRRYLTQLQNAESAFKRMMSLAYLRNCSKNVKIFTNAFPVFGHRVSVTPFADRDLQIPHTTRLEVKFVNFARLCGGVRAKKCTREIKTCILPGQPYNGYLGLRCRAGDCA